MWPAPVRGRVRRIYESDAVVRDDDPHTPSEREDDDPGPRTIDWANASHALLPIRVRDWAITVDVETSRERYAVGEPVDLRVRFRNRLPFSVQLRTATPVRWQWAVDGIDGASVVERGTTPNGRGTFSFTRSERKTFTRTWNQSIQRTAREWEPVAPGEHTISARVNVPDAETRGLTAETTVHIDP